jgi:hypothetical protein
MSSKKYKFLTIVCCLFIGMTYSVLAQFTQPYLVKEALPNVKKAAADSGWTNPSLTAIATIGDTTGLGQAGGLLGGGFDLKSGRSTIWVYILSVTDNSGNTSSKLLAYIKVQLLGFQQIPLPSDAVPGDIPFEPQDSIPTASMLNSDAIATSMSANTQYKDFMNVNPKAKPAFIVLFTSPFPIPETSFSAGTPLWNFNFSDPADSLAPNLSCFVNAINGETFCFDSEGPVSIDEEIATQNSDLQMSIHPIPNGMNGSITILNGLQEATLDVVDLFGRTMFETTVHQSGTSTLMIPRLSPGIYVARLKQADKFSTIRFIQQ